MRGRAALEPLPAPTTTAARLRSLAAIDAASLAAAMHSNRQYWAKTALPFDLALNAGAITSTSDPGLATQAAADMATVPDNVCFGAPCAALALAAFDVARWSTNVTGLLPNARAAIAFGSRPVDRKSTRLNSSH